MSLEDDSFDYQITKSGVLLIRRGGHTVMELGGKKAAALIPRLGRGEDSDQQLLARDWKLSARKRTQISSTVIQAE
jgi:hypothetical protein